MIEKKRAYEWTKGGGSAEPTRDNIHLAQSWIVSQYKHEYNPWHTHSGHFSGVIYLKIPEDMNKQYDEEFKEYPVVLAQYTPKQTITKKNLQDNFFKIMKRKPNKEELAHPILVIKARMSKGAWALPVTRKGPYLSNIVQRVNIMIICRMSKDDIEDRPRTCNDSIAERNKKRTME